MDLFDEDEVHQITINEHFAAAYAAKKEREELSKLKDKYGSEGEEDEEEDDESEEDEDEDGEELTPAMDAAILKTLSRIRRGDPTIYEKGKNVFEEEARRLARESGKFGMPERQHKDRSKPITLRDMAIDALLNPARDEEPVSTHAEEQAALRAETISAFRSVAADDDDDLLTLRNTTDEMDSATYRQFLLEAVGEDDLKAALSIEAEGATGQSARTAHEAEHAKTVRRKKKDRTDAAADEDFLMNYILNRGWVDGSPRRNPTFEEATTLPPDNASHSHNPTAEIIQELPEDDSEFEDITEKFESSYNFRFEEPNATVIATHPRNLQSTVRRQDDHRKQEREKRKARKAEELLVKQEELKRLKALKRKEIEEKLKMLGHVSGKEGELFPNQGKILGSYLPGIRSDQLDLEGDFDPHAHDSQMRGIFDEDEYYAQADESKPTWADDIDISDITADAGEKLSRTRRKKHHRDANAVEPDEIDGPYASNNADGQSRIDEYMDEYFGLDYNGMIGDLPTRFKYMQVPSTSFGLTPTEILLADDNELNSFMGMKKYAPYRSDETSKRGKRYWELKEALKGRSWTGDAGDGGTIKSTKARRGKKERARLRALQGEGTRSATDEADPEQRPAKRHKVA
ncbi:Krr1-domain-containing protein [Calocera cornea HHB12733]|uniref:Krr1-domain-containing protein n=1 Tax=Calocera cornea HHB12733 TaxID=1353952 RepID=A0A165IYX6_9BASI|nr:Krr1-domain-containing protein [Calocera cornea HHB12733]